MTNGRLWGPSHQDMEPPFPFRKTHPVASCFGGLLALNADLALMPTHSDTVSYQTQRQRVLIPGDVARLPGGHGLLLRGADWELLGLTRWYEREPWRRVSGGEG